MYSNLALHPPMLCESVVHNALQQQDRGNYHNQRRRSINLRWTTGSKWSREEEKQRKMSLCVRKRDRRSWRWDPCLLAPQNSKVSCQKTPARIINHSEKIYLSTLLLFLSSSSSFLSSFYPFVPRTTSFKCVFSIIFRPNSSFVFLSWLCHCVYCFSIPAPALLKRVNLCVDRIAFTLDTKPVSGPCNEYYFTSV